MLKKIKATALGLFILFFAGITLNCYGRFVITTRLLMWNGTVGDKFVNSAVMWAMIIIPVYGVAVFIDFVALNTIEFWTGSNPLGMAPGETETKLVKVQGKEFKITASQNQMEIVPMQGPAAGKKTVMRYSTDEAAWYLYDADTMSGQKIVEVQDNTLAFRHPDGSVLSVPMYK